MFVKLVGKPTSFGKLSSGYHDYCSYTCMNNNKDKIKKAKQTTFDHFGVEYPAQSKIVQEKCKNTCLEKFGVENPSQAQEIKEKKVQTCLEHYGVSSFTKTNEYKEKTRKTCLEKYGCEHFNQNDEVKEKQKKTLYEHYGVTNPRKSEILKEKSIQTCLKKYGCKNPMQSEQIREKAKQTCLKKYGCEHVMRVREIFLKQKQKFFKDGKYYDSSWEYKYEQFLIKNNIRYIYQPDFDFSYYFENKKHKYFPDFAIYNDDGSLREIIDIKGDHIFKKMLIENTKENEKYKCILKNNVKLLFKDDLKKLGIII